MRKNQHRLPGLTVVNHEFILPLDYANPTGQKITVFAREVVASGNEERALPWLIFFQGGPGFASPRPFHNGGWLKRALDDYRVLLLDQRGTGLSTAITFQTIARLESPQAMADYLKHFRTESIVRDAEMIRRELVGKHGKWTGLGQSYGGFCLTHYLCAAPQGLEAAIITGGLPPVDVSVDDIYRATYRRVLEKNRRYLSRYPDDKPLIEEIIDYLLNNNVPLPGGGKLSARRFQQCGIELGMSDGFETVHYLLEQAFTSGKSGRELSYTFLRACENLAHFETNPIYALLHEAIYCENRASNWSAQRVLSEYPELDLAAGKNALFTGEMIYPWMFDDYAYLKPLKEAAQILAEFDQWPGLYDTKALSSASVPVVAAVYCNDMYVERAFSEKTAEYIAGIRLWITNEYEHNAIRSDGQYVLNKLLNMLRGHV